MYIHLLRFERKRREKEKRRKISDVEEAEVDGYIAAIRRAVKTQLPGAPPCIDPPDRPRSYRAVKIDNARGKSPPKLKPVPTPAARYTSIHFGLTSTKGARRGEWGGRVITGGPRYARVSRVDRVWKEGGEDDDGDDDGLILPLRGVPVTSRLININDSNEPTSQLRARLLLNSSRLDPRPFLSLFFSFSNRNRNRCLDTSPL